jgi:hypothetical protein
MEAAEKDVRRNGDGVHGVQQVFTLGLDDDLRQPGLVHFHDLLTLWRENDHAPARLPQLLHQFTQNKTFARACTAAKNRNAVCRTQQGFESLALFIVELRIRRTGIPQRSFPRIGGAAAIARQTSGSTPTGSVIRNRSDANISESKGAADNDCMAVTRTILDKFCGGSGNDGVKKQREH